MVPNAFCELKTDWPKTSPIIGSLEMFSLFVGRFFCSVVQVSSVQTFLVA